MNLNEIENGIIKAINAAIEEEAKMVVGVVYDKILDATLVITPTCSSVEGRIVSVDCDEQDIHISVDLDGYEKLYDSAADEFILRQKNGNMQLSVYPNRNI